MVGIWLVCCWYMVGKDFNHFKIFFKRYPWLGNDGLGATMFFVIRYPGLSWLVQFKNVLNIPFILTKDIWDVLMKIEKSSQDMFLKISLVGKSKIPINRIFPKSATEHSPKVHVGTFPKYTVQATPILGRQKIPPRINPLHPFASHPPNSSTNPILAQLVFPPSREPESQT